VALNATTGAILWHANLGIGASNGPMTYELAAGDTLYGFAMFAK